MRSVWIALGLFFALWWTWVGFAVLYNRHGADEPASGCCSSPAASRPASRRSRSSRPPTGDSTAFALSLAATRLVLAAAHASAARSR